MVKQIYDVEVFVGCSEEEINKLKQVYGTLPMVPEEFLRTWGNTEKLLTVMGNFGERV